VFSVEERDRVRDRVLEMARADPRIVAGALIGAPAAGDDDRWSDLDLGFGLAAGAGADEVLAGWTADLVREFDAIHLFDLPYLSSVYRVLLFPGNLQVDLSFTPAADFGALGPKFSLLFGTAAERTPPPSPAARDLFGLGVHHAVRARICVERGRVWQAEFWLSGVRDQALALACHRLGLETANGRGFDRLPGETLELAAATLVRRLERAYLLGALGTAIELLIQEADEVADLAAKIAPRLRELAAE
jgi:hypothetical protein